MKRLRFMLATILGATNLFAANLFAANLFAAKGYAQQAPTYRSQIAPIFNRNCTSCHHTGGAGPFPLTTYAQVKRFLTVIDQATSTRFMPPWLPTPGHGAFAETRRLSDSDLARLHAWILAGAPEGNGLIPTPPVYDANWELGPPDLVLQMDTPIAIPADGPDLFTNVILPNPLEGTHWVRAMEIHPGAVRVVHHANVLVDRTASLRRTHPGWRSGIPGMDIEVDSGDSFDPDSHFLFWKPDSTALVEPAGMPWRLDQGNDLVLNLHLKPSGKAETTQARIGLYFTDKPATQHPMLLQLEDDAALDIPAGDAAFPVEDSLQLPVPVDVLGIYPHAHYLGKRLEAWATLPDGSRKDLILIEDWDIDRQSVYRLARPLPLPASTVLHMRYLYDNSAANPRNPHSPPIRVHAGNRSEDEMAHLWLQVLPMTTPGHTELEARQALERAWMQNRLTKSPDDALALYNLASLDLTTGQPARAIEIFRQLLALTPPGRHPDPRTLTALGTALNATGQTDEAEAQFRAALAVSSPSTNSPSTNSPSTNSPSTNPTSTNSAVPDPAATDAAFDLASLDLQSGSLPEAQTLLEAQVQQRPDDAQVHRLLAMVYSRQNRLVETLAQLHLWQALAPKDPDPHRALAQTYAQVGRLPDALREQQTVLALAPDNASDFNDLGVMQAEAGNSAAARRAFQQALQLDPALEAATANLKKLNP
jgi:Flp pilus assembly protein TadD/mono/diheme cytochrome c family protein